jgi:hypothetical protein
LAHDCLWAWDEEVAGDEAQPALRLAVAQQPVAVDALAEADLPQDVLRAADPEQVKDAGAVAAEDA